VLVYLVCFEFYNLSLSLCYIAHICYINWLKFT